MERIKNNRLQLYSYQWYDVVGGRGKKHTRRVPGQRAVERDEISLSVKVHDATLRPLLNIMDSASHNPVASATVRNLRSPIII